MKLDFRIDWGYQYLYSRRLYHPTYIWDGNITVSSGEITEIYQLSYPYSWYGISHTPKETKLDKPEWKSTTKRGFSGIRIVAEVNEDATFELHTKSGDVVFTAKDVIEKGRLDFPIGPKYLGCSILVNRTGYYWFRPKSLPNETVWSAEDLGLDVHSWARCELAWLRPGHSVKFKYNVPNSKKDVNNTIIHTIGMAAPEYDTEKESQLDGYIPFELYCDGIKVASFSRFYRRHDFTLQLLEDAWVTVNVPSGEHEFELKNMHPNFCFAISSISAKQEEINHGQLLVPKWVLVGERIKGKVYSIKNENIDISVLGSDITVPCNKGWNEFDIVPSSTNNKTIKTAYDSKEIEIYDVKDEKIPVKVGFDCTTVPHDDTGFMDWILDYTSGTRLGNYVLFRSFNGFVDKNVSIRWGKFCKEHGIYISTSNEWLCQDLAEGAEEYFHDWGKHEYTGCVYAFDPTPETSSSDMKEASEKFTSYLKAEIDEIHKVCKNAAFGDASGGIRYSFLAGATFVRAETMVGPTMPLTAQARASSEALGNGTWGVHIAIMHCFVPFKESHLGQYFLSIMQPWAMGAETIYEEDSLFNIFTDERNTWSDYLTKGKRDMTRQFFKFAKTHPRQGKNVRNIAVLDGRYAAPFNGFTCDKEQDPSYTVWGKFGNTDKTWGHLQPEKSHQVLDVLMPGTSTHPLMQDVNKRRFFFAGTPYGDFDFIPVEASLDFYKNYKLIINLGWNTLIDEDYNKTIDYVKSGGTVITGIPQFSTHIRREFLADMKDLALYNDGDLSEICGFKVKGIGKKYSGQWNCADRCHIVESELSSHPSFDISEDGPAMLSDIELCGAEIIAWDAQTGEPMLVRNKVGNGYIYTFTMWAYAGHEQFQKFAATWVEVLSKDAMTSDIYLTDDSREVFWTRWVDGDKTTIMLLNTDWTNRGNIKNVTLVTGNSTHSLSVKERSILIVEIENSTIKVDEHVF